MGGLGDIRIYAGPSAGSIILQVRPQRGTTSYYRRKGGRRYLFCTDKGFGCWLSEETWRYEIGFVQRSEPLWRCKETLKLEQPAQIAVSYDCAKGELYFGWCEIDEQPVCNPASNDFFYPEGVGSNWSLLGRWGEDSFNGVFQGLLTTAKLVQGSAMKYALRTRTHFLPLDSQHYPLTDAVLERAILLATDV